MTVSSSCRFASSWRINEGIALAGNASTLSVAVPKMPRETAAGAATQTGQAAFAAIAEIVRILEADPKTDWSKVNLEALRQHLIDMDDLTLRATVATQPVTGGATFTVTGAGRVRDAIRRMAKEHG